MNYFQTSNVALSITLATCGVPYALDSEGQSRPFIHFYDAQILANLGYKGWKLEDAARDAWRTGKKGRIVYQFQRTPVLERILKAYDAHSALIAQSDESAIPLQCSLDIEPETAAKLCCQFTKNRTLFTQGWKSIPPCIVTHGPLTKEQEGGKTFMVGSFKLISLGATAEARKKIGI